MGDLDRVSMSPIDKSSDERTPHITLQWFCQAISALVRSLEGTLISTAKITINIAIIMDWLIDLTFFINCE